MSCLRLIPFLTRSSTDMLSSNHVGIPPRFCVVFFGIRTYPPNCVCLKTSFYSGGLLCTELNPKLSVYFPSLPGVSVFRESVPCLFRAEAVATDAESA